VGEIEDVIRDALPIVARRDKSTASLRRYEGARHRKRKDPVKKATDNKLKVVAVRVDPQIEQRLRLLAEVTGRKQSFFLQQMIERGLADMEETWLPQNVLSQVRSGAIPAQQKAAETTLDLFEQAGI
jgi:RHH-type transcriptional regulator, rel operon repressor / antitoxin RelB